MIADEFTLEAFRYEWECVPVNPDTSEGVLDTIELLFVESAWHGNDNAWQFQIVGQNAPSSALRELVANCRRRDVPTMFWNKEDPAHFADFVKTAGLFDTVFTTEGRCIEDYRKRLGHGRVFLLPFAAQPSLHNPMRTAEPRNLGLLFAGTYFAHKYPERRAQMEMLLGGAVDVHDGQGIDVDIFARFQGNDPNHAFPPPFDRFVRGELSYKQVLSAYRRYRILINVNSVPDSHTMCARRVFEATACGVVVVSALSPAIEAYLGDAVVECRDRAEATNVFRALLRSSELRDRLSYQGQMTIWEKHSCRHRADTILRAVGMDDAVLGAAWVSVLVATNRPSQVGHVIGQLARQRGVRLQVLILTHGFVSNEADRNHARDLGLRVEWLEGEESWSLGTCYNRLLERASSPVSAKFDDDDEYGPHYLLEQVTALEYSGARLVGKQSHFARLEGNTQNYVVVRSPGHENCATDFVSGPTFVFNTEFVRSIGFEDRSTGEDTALLRAVGLRGGLIWSTSKYGFLQVRKRDGHTWRVRNADILANAEVVSGDFTGV